MLSFLLFLPNKKKNPFRSESSLMKYSGEVAYEMFLLLKISFFVHMHGSNKGLTICSVKCNIYDTLHLKLDWIC